MASLADGRHSAGRWSLVALFRRLQSPPRPHAPAAAAIDLAATAPRAELPKRRSYAPARDAFLENSAMRREMHRL